MSEEPEVETEEPDVSITLEAPDQVAYDELVNNFSEELVQADLEEVVKQRVRTMYDNQGQIKQQLAKAQQAAQQ
jgi:hypothetical protein